MSATALMVSIGDVSRSPSSRHLVAYRGLNPRVHQCGAEPGLLDDAHAALRG